MKKDIESINAKVSKTSDEKAIVLLKCPVCSSKSRFIIRQEARGILSKLTTRTPLIK